MPLVKIYTREKNIGGGVKHTESRERMDIPFEAYQTLLKRNQVRIMEMPSAPAVLYHRASDTAAEFKYRTWNAVWSIDHTLLGVYDADKPVCEAHGTFVEGLNLEAYDVGLRLRSLEAKLRDFWVGKIVKVVDQRFNGQPYGKSKKPLYGCKLRVNGASIHNGEVFLSFENVDASLSVKGVRLYE